VHPLIDRKRPEITRICKENDVKRLEIFGCAARATDFDPATSDADFIVEFAPDTKNRFKAYFSVKEALEKLLGRSVDLVEPGVLKNPFVIASINQSRELVYAA
jgi:predicted nucleotidyltransferase